jgi:hypothetical protein
MPLPVTQFFILIVHFVWLSDYFKTFFSTASCSALPCLLSAPHECLRIFWAVFVLRSLPIEAAG